MKFILIAYNEAIEDEIQRTLSQLGIENYTQWDKVYGKGSHSGPHLGTHVWPKHNNVMAVAVEDEKSGELMDRIRDLRKEYGREGIKAFKLPLEEMT